MVAGEIISYLWGTRKAIIGSPGLGQVLPQNREALVESAVADLLHKRVPWVGVGHAAPWLGHVFS